MKPSVRNIMQAINELEPCNKSKEINSWSKLFKVLFTPRGTQFCIKYKFPTLELLRLAGNELSKYGVFTDAGKLTLYNCRRTILAGDTQAVIYVSDNDFPTEIMAIHGAKAVIYTTEYPVTIFTEIDGNITVNITRFGKRSINNLVGVHPDLVKLMCEAIKETPYDFVVTEGVRTLERQQQLYAQGRTQPGKIVTYADGVRKKSNHQLKTDGYGYAVDIYPLINGRVGVNAVDELKVIASHIYEIAKQFDIPISWGGDWKIRDYPHFELIISTS